VAPSDTISRADSLTNKAIVTKSLVIHDDIQVTIGELRRITGDAVRQLSLTHMVSLPAADLKPSDRTPFVLNLFFSDADLAGFSEHQIEIQWLMGSLGIALDYLALRVSKQIRSAVDGAGEQATGISNLFDAMRPHLECQSALSRAAIYSYSAGPERLKLERYFGYSASDLLIPNPGGDESYGEMVANCLHADRETSLYQRRPPAKHPGDDRYDCWPIAVVPIRANSGNPIGALLCEKEPLLERQRSFSSFDVLSLDAFSRAMAPYVERFHRLRSASALIEVIKDVCLPSTETENLDAFLQGTIDRVRSAFNAGIASIYLLANDGELAGTYVMRASSDPAKHLIGRAHYRSGEGLTGRIACGQVLNFKSWEEREQQPERLAKYEKDIWPRGRDRSPENYLGVPILGRDHVIGVWKVEDLLPSPSHPDPYFTDEDVQIARVLSSVLAYLIEDHAHRTTVSKYLTLLSQSTVRIETADSEDEAVQAIINALNECGLGSVLFSLYDEKSRTIVGGDTAGPCWQTIVDRVRVSIDSNDIAALALSKNQAFFVPDSTLDDRCDAESTRIAQLRAQFVVPLRTKSELIGTLQVDLGSQEGIDARDQLLLEAFASHLTLAISRIRSIRRSLELTDQVMSSGRFVAAETLAGMAIHSLNHVLSDMTRVLGRELERNEVKQRRELSTILGSWKEKLDNAQRSVTATLDLVKTPITGDNANTDVHSAIQESLDTWIGFLKANKCVVQKHLHADPSFCAVPRHAFKEIVSVLLVNSVQANARNAWIRTTNVEDMRSPAGHRLVYCVLIEFSDDGQGLATNTPEEIFGPTYTTKPDKFGTGLGLYIGRLLARRTNGDLWFQPTEGKKGATFILALPVARAKRRSVSP
jgi:signal transduction histidine kinase